MTTPADTLPDDISSLKTIIVEKVLKNLRQEELISQRDQELAQLRAHNDRLIEMVRLLRHHRFGRSSEKIRSAGSEKQLELFNEAEELTKKRDANKSTEEEAVEVKGYKRRGKPKRIALPADLPREEVIIDLAEEEKFCSEGHPLECIGEETSEQLDIIPAQIKVIRTIRKKYACKICGDCVKRAPVPPAAIPKSMAAPGLLAYIATNKYGDGLPLYRQEHMWQRAGVDIPRGTMANWMIKVGELLRPMINLMEEDILESGYVHADETKVQVLKESGKLAESLSYMWVRSRDGPGVKPIVVFEYDPTRSGDVAKRLFAEYRGYLQVDGYAGYNGICASDGVVRLGCFAHARRKFVEAAKASKKGEGIANEAIEQIRKLYEIEASAKEMSDEDRYSKRQEESKPLLDEMRIWLDDKLSKVPPKSQLGIALGYLDGEWEYLKRYIDDGRLCIDNNLVENAIRPFAIGRKNWLFSDSVAGAKSSAAIYSVMISAKLNGHNEYEYLRHLLEQLPRAKSADEIAALLPHNLNPEEIPSN